MLATAESLLERDTETRRLYEAMDAAIDGNGRLVLVEGEAGIGKTRLLVEARATASEKGMLILGARGTELERSFPFAVARQLFGPVLADPARRRELLAGVARPAGPALGVEPEPAEPRGVAGEVPGLLSATLNALFWLTSNLAESQPLVLSVDDAHWGDRGSLLFLRYLLPRLEDLPVLLVVASRPDEPEAPRALLAELATDPARVVLRPAPLSAGAAARLVRTELAPGADDEFCLACHGSTGGNPFLLRELVDELIAQGRAGTADEATEVADIAPAAIRQGVLLRLDRLPATDRDVARAVAVLGEDADARTVAALAGLSSAAATEALDRLAAAGILDPREPLRYRHPLLRSAVTAEVPPMELKGAHARAAELLVAAHAEPERVAVHLLAAAPAGDPAVADTLEAAARRALARAAPDAAASYLRRALSEPADPERRPALLRMLIAAGLRAGSTAAMVTAHIDLVGELSADDETLLASAWELAMWLLAADRADDARGLLDRAGSLAADRGDLDAALRLDSLLVSSRLLTPVQGRARFARHAGAVAPDTPTERLWLALQSWWGTFLGDTAANTGQMAARALADGRIFHEHPDAAPPAQAVLVLARTEQIGLAAAHTEQLVARARQTGSAHGLAQGAFLRATLAHLTGDISRADAESGAAVEAARRGGYLSAVPIYLAARVEALIDRDDLDGAQRELGDYDRGGCVPDDYWWTPLWLSRGRLRVAQRRFDEAMSDLSAVERANARDGSVNPDHGVGSHRAMALAGQGRRDEALEAAAKEVERARAWGTPRAIAAALRTLARVGPRDESLSLLESALDALGTSPMELERMRVLTDLGAELRRSNRRADARAPLAEALELARRGGALAIGRVAHAELAATGEKLRPLGAGGVASLTPAERRVAELAAEGLANREIAQTLFLTVKTVETHLSSAYRKLEIRSRHDLGGAL